MHRFLGFSTYVESTTLKHGYKQSLSYNQVVSKFKDLCYDFVDNNSSNSFAMIIFKKLKCESANMRLEQG